MDKINEQRTEARLHCPWFVQFAGSVKEMLSQGRMVDVSSEGMAFLCYADKSCPTVGKLILLRFSVPRFDSDKCFDTESYNCVGRVRRVCRENNFLRRIAVQFASPLSFKPGEQPISKYDEIYKTVTNSDGITAALSLKLNQEYHYQTTSDEIPTH